MTVSIVAALFGALVGVILGLTGAGGAIIAVPLLVFGLQLTLTEAAPIALLTQWKRRMRSGLMKSSAEGHM